MTKRIWELDALRGICVLGMVAVHLGYDLGLAGNLAALDFLMDWGGVAFLLISGCCVTLGSRHIRRGLVVFGCGLVCTAVTAGMYLLGLADKLIIIYFGVLHCLGSCMLLWGLFSRLPGWLLAALGLTLAAVGLWLLAYVRVDTPWLIPLGLLTPGFGSSDYFPLFPNLGYFLLGAAVGRVLYPKKESLLPRVDAGRQPLRFLCQCGRWSLPIYLLHQPILTGILWLIHR